MISFLILKQLIQERGIMCEIEKDPYADVCRMQGAET